MRKLTVLAGILPLFLMACASTPNPYPNGPGFYDTRIENDRYRVVYRAPGGLARDQVEDQALLRAADVTLSSGFDWFRIAGRQGSVDQPSGPVVSLGTGSTNFGRRSAVGVGVGTSFRLGGPPAQTLMLEIQMGRGPTPEDRAAYDAREVSRTLRERLG